MQEIQPSTWLPGNPPMYSWGILEISQEGLGWSNLGAGQEVGDSWRKSRWGQAHIQCSGLNIQELCDLKQAT